MANLNGFDANEVDPNPGFDPIPAGKYLAIITASEMKPTRNGKGEYLQFELDILDGPHKGRKVWDRLVIKHSNQQTVEIAKGTLSAVCHAVGVMAPKDSAELHNLPLMVTVGLKKRDDTGELTNVVKSYSKRDSGPGAAGAPVVNGPGSTPPWARK
ncbi:MAG: DUF669 domain-containing protein [Phycisphaerales bacterium]|nr:DUF669 domain-containing protein [Phycisphaerales bacterium]